MLFDYITCSVDAPAIDMLKQQTVSELTSPGAWRGRAILLHTLHVSFFFFFFLLLGSLNTEDKVTCSDRCYMISAISIDASCRLKQNSNARSLSFSPGALRLKLYVESRVNYTGFEVTCCDEWKYTNALQIPMVSGEVLHTHGFGRNGE